MKRLIFAGFALALLSACTGPAEQSAAPISSSVAAAPAPNVTAAETLIATADNVRRASLRALGDLDVRAVEQTRAGAGWMLIADTPTHAVAILIEPLDPNATRIHVTADQRAVAASDAAAANDIVARTAQIVAATDRLAQAQRRSTAIHNADFVQSRWRRSTLVHAGASRRDAVIWP